jgi:dipeptide transport system substrate-binding protein
MPLSAAPLRTWCYKPFDDLIKRARATTVIAARTADYGETQRIFKDRVPLTLIAHSIV